MYNIDKLKPIIFEPTCAHARWALMHHLASVRDWRQEINSYLEKYYS